LHHLVFQKLNDRFCFIFSQSSQKDLSHTMIGSLYTSRTFQLLKGGTSSRGHISRIVGRPRTWIARSGQGHGLASAANHTGRLSRSWSSVSERLVEAVKTGLLLEDAGQTEAAHQADRCITRVRKYAKEREAYLREVNKTAKGEAAAASGQPSHTATSLNSTPAFLDAPSVPPTSSEPRVFHPAIKGRPSALHAAASKRLTPHPALAAAAASQADASPPSNRPQPPRMPKGLYFFGSVGTGKTQLMDTLIATLSDMRKEEEEEGGEQKADIAVRRLHFHSLLASIHARLHEMRKLHPVDDPKSPSDRDLIARAAEELASIATVAVICVDDLELVDVADAFLLDHYFRTLHHSGAVLIFSSNWAPTQLYKDGLQKELFVPFQRMLEAVCRIVELQGKDYRQVTRGSSSENANSPTAAASNEARQSSNEALAALLADASGWETKDVPISHGRSVRVQALKLKGDVALIDFEALCGSENPLGAADFTALAMTFKELVVKNMPYPSFKRLQHNELRRLIHCLDVYYDLRGRLRLLQQQGDASSTPRFIAQKEHLAALFANFLPVEEALAPATATTVDSESDNPLGSLSTRPTVFVSDDDITAGKGVITKKKDNKILKDTTDAPASNILSVRVEEAAKATLHMGIRRGLSRLIEMASLTAAASSSVESTSSSAFHTSSTAAGVGRGHRAFDALNRDLLVGQIPESVKATLLK
jgi:cell division protein ZapE